ncbi:nucleotidyltransferase domain-containing protein [Thermococci archaeon]|nr:MAG: nucleotidyltransferase domain-containing protein [Thermococci archaeon]
MVVKVFEEVGGEIRRAFGDRVKEIIVFGSRARGDSTPESDLDVLVVVDEIRSTDWDTVGKLSAELTLRLGISVMIVLHTRRDLLYRIAVKEGMLI